MLFGCLFCWTETAQSHCLWWGWTSPYEARVQTASSVLNVERVSREWPQHTVHMVSLCWAFSFSTLHSFGSSQYQIMSLFFSLFSLSYFSPSCSGYISHPTHFLSTFTLIFPFLSFHFHYLPCPLSFPLALPHFYQPSFSSLLPSLPYSSFAVPTACLLALFRHRGPGVPVALCPRYVTLSFYCYLIVASFLSVPLLSPICTTEDKES